MSEMKDQAQGNNQAANPKIWGLMEKTEMETTNRTLTGQLNISRNPAKSNPIRTLGVLAVGAMLATSVLLSGSIASADEANRPTTKEQVASVGSWDVYADARDIQPKLEQVNLDFDTYVDARDIQISQTDFRFSAKLVSTSSVAVGNWDVYTDARDMLPKVEQVNLEFDTYQDARDIQISHSELQLMAKLGTSNSAAVGNWDVYTDARDMLPKVEQVNLDFDTYQDARDIQIFNSELQLTAKLGSGNSAAVGNWDAYLDARDLRQTDSDFDAYVDARDIRSG